MKKGCLILSGIILVLLVGLVVIGLIVDRNYGVLIGDPAVSHESFMPGGTRIRLLIRPPMARQFLETHVLSQMASKVPAWALDQVMPREIALMARPETDGTEFQTTLFVNPVRLGPRIRSLVNSNGLLSRLAFVTWDPEGFTRPQRGALISYGAQPIPTRVANFVWTRWNQGLTLPILPLQGNHAIELSCDNRNGGCIAILGGAMAAMGMDPGMLENDQVAPAVSCMQTLHIVGDFTNEAALELKVELVCDAPPFELSAGLPYLLNSQEPGTLKWHLKRRGITLTGEGKWDGETFRGTYLLEDMPGLISQYTGRSQP